MATRYRIRLRRDRGDESEQRTLTAQTVPAAMLPKASTGMRSISTSNVLAVADAFAAVRVLADSISTLPLKVFQAHTCGPGAGG